MIDRRMGIVNDGDFNFEPSEKEKYVEGMIERRK